MYPALIAMGLLLFYLYGRRVVFTVKFFTAKSHAGDYDGALRRLRRVHFGLSRPMALHHEGLILVMADRAGEAEPLFRKALRLIEDRSHYPRVRLYSSLGHALANLGGYDDAEEWLQQAIRAGDTTGNSWNGLAQLRIAQGRLDEALAAADYAIAAAKRRANSPVPPVYYQDRAWALALLGRRDEARESLALAPRATRGTAASLGSFEWKFGLTLLALGERETANEHFRRGAAADPNGKCGHRCAEELRKADLRK